MTDFNKRDKEFKLFNKLRDLSKYEPYDNTDYKKLLGKYVTNKKFGDIHIITAVDITGVMVSGFGWVTFEELLNEYLFVTNKGYRVIGKYKK